MQDKLVENEERAKKFFSEFEGKYQTVMRIVDRIDDYTRQLEEQEDELKKLDKINSTQYERDLKDYTRRRKELEDKKLALAEKKGQADGKISECDSRYKKILAESSKNDSAALAYCYAEIGRAHV